MAITSNLLLATQVPKPTGDGFQSVVQELTQIKQLLDSIKRTKTDINITVSGNVKQQLQSLQQVIQQNLGSTGGAAGGGKGIRVPVVVDPRGLSQVNTSVEELNKNQTELAKRASEYRAQIAGSNDLLKKATVTSRQLVGDLEQVTKVTAQQGRGILKNQEIIRTETKVKDLAQERANLEAKRASNAQRRQDQAIQRSNREIQSLESQGFVRSITEGTSSILTFRKAFNQTLDDIAKVNLKTGEATFSRRENVDNVRAVNRELQTQIGALEAAKQRANILAQGFQKVGTSFKETVRGRQEITEFRKTLTGPLELFKGKPELQLARLNEATGELNVTTLQGARAAKLIGDNFLSSVGKVLQWTVATSAVFGTVRILKEATTQAAALEEGTILLARVGKGFENSLRGTQGEIEEQVRIAKRLTDEIINLGLFYGSSAAEAQKAAAIFARAGLNQQQTLEATRVAIIASKIAELGLVESARLLSAEQAQFSLTTEQLATSLDRLNSLSNNYRVTTNDLLQAVSRAGSVFAEQGRTVDELTSLTAVLSQTTARTGSEIGTALKTIASNLERVDVARKLVQATGVAFQDAEGATGNFSTTLALLQVQLDKLTRTERNNLIIQTSGVRQRNIFEAALRQSTESLIAQARTLRDEGSASNELKLQITTLNSAIERLGSSFTKLVQSQGVVDALKDLVNVLNALVLLASAFDGTLIKLGVTLGIFLLIRKAVGPLFALIGSLIQSFSTLGVSNQIVAATSIQASNAMIAEAAAARVLGLAMASLNIISAALTVGLIAAAGATTFFTESIVQNQIEQERRTQQMRDATQQAIDLAIAERNIAEVLGFQVKRLKEVETRLNSLKSARQNISAQAGPGKQRVITRLEGQIGPEEQRLQINRAKLLEDIQRIAKARGVSIKNIADSADATKALAEITGIASAAEVAAIKNTEKLREEERERTVGIEQQIEKIRELIDAINTGPQKEKIGGVENPFDIFFEQRHIDNINARLKELGKTLGDDKLEKLTQLFSLDEPKIIKALEDHITSFNLKIIESNKKVSEFDEQLLKVQKTATQIKIIEITDAAIKNFRRMKLEIEAFNESSSRVTSLADSLNLDKTIAKQQQLNQLKEIDADLTAQINELTQAGLGESETVKELSEELQKLRKIQIDLDVERFRSQVETLSTFLKKRFQDAFETGGNITRRSVTASRRFSELGEELDELHIIGAETKRVQTSFDELFRSAQAGAQKLSGRLAELKARQDLAASNVLLNEARKEGIDTGGLNSINLLSDPSGKRKLLEDQVRNSAIEEARKQDIIRRASRAAALQQPDADTTLDFVQTQTLREESANRLNELADLQLRMAEELIAKEREITAELRQQTKEQIKQLGLLSEEDKLRVLAQAAFFANNPSAQISASTQFLASAETNRIGQEFFANRLAKDFDTQKEPLGKLFFAAGFGNERTRQLQESQAALRARREQVAGPGATDDQVLATAISAANKLREQALRIQNEMLDAFFKKLTDRGEVFDNLRTSGLQFTRGGDKNGQAAFSLSFTPEVAVEPFIQGIENVINGAFQRLGDQLTEFAREQFFLDPNKFGRPNQGVPGAGAFGIAGPAQQGGLIQFPGPVFPGARPIRPGQQGVPTRQQMQQLQGQQSPVQIQAMKPVINAPFKTTGEAVFEELGKGNYKDAIRTFFLGKQHGGMIGGSGTGDKTPVLAEPGEFFLNKVATARLLPFLKWWNEMNPRFGGSPSPGAAKYNQKYPGMTMKVATGLSRVGFQRGGRVPPRGMMWSEKEGRWVNDDERDWQLWLKEFDIYERNERGGFGRKLTDAEKRSIRGSDIFPANSKYLFSPTPGPDLVVDPSLPGGGFRVPAGGVPPAGGPTLRPPGNIPRRSGPFWRAEGPPQLRPPANIPRRSGPFWRDWDDSSPSDRLPFAPGQPLVGPGRFEPRMDFGEGRFEPRLDFGLGQQSSGRRDGGRFVPREDFNLLHALGRGDQVNFGTPPIFEADVLRRNFGGPGVALRAPASAGVGRAPASAGVGGRAPSRAEVPVTRRQREAAAQNAELQARIQNFISQPVGPEAEAAAIKKREEDRAEARRKVEDAVARQDARNQEGFARTRAKIEEIKAREEANAADPNNLRNQTQARIDAIKAREQAEAEDPNSTRNRIKARLEFLRNVGDTVQLANPQPGKPKQETPLDKVRKAIRDQTELDRQRRKAEFEEARQRRQQAFNNRGEQFVQNELARRGIGGGGAIISNGKAVDFGKPQGVIPGVPANIGPAPFFQPNRPARVGEPQHEMPRRGPNIPGDPTVKGQAPVMPQHVGFSGQTVHPDIDWGNAMADFENKIGQALVNAFTRVAPILAQQIEQNLRNIPAKPANFRPVA